MASRWSRAREAQHPCAACNDLRRPKYLDADGSARSDEGLRARRGIGEPDGGSAAPARLSSDCQPPALGARADARSAADPTHDATFHRHRCGEAVLRAMPPRGPRDRRRPAVGAGRQDGPGLLTVSAPVTLGLARVCPHVPALLAKHPGLRIDLRLEDRVVDIVSDGVDIAIRSGIDPPDSSSLIAQPLMTYGRILVASPA